MLGVEGSHVDHVATDRLNRIIEEVRSQNVCGIVDAQGEMFERTLFAENGYLP